MLTRVATDGGRAAATWMGQELRRAGVLVDQCSLDQVASDEAGRVSVREQLHQVSSRFTGMDLVVYLADELTMADAGGPWLRQTASWAERALTPVIAVAPTCHVSTREWRSLGVEAGYAVTTPDDARLVVVTWVPTSR
ncbi:MAG: hypothetical protein LBV00_07120 [Propionibacteriaceae bacterium]|nr:hypothetical protein [Propionibacteriaceae bacterium]